MLCALYARRDGLCPVIAGAGPSSAPICLWISTSPLANFIRDGLKGGPIAVNGDGTPIRSYLYASDLAIWLWTILFKGQRAGLTMSVPKQTCRSAKWPGSWPKPFRRRRWCGLRVLPVPASPGRLCAFDRTRPPRIGPGRKDFAEGCGHSHRRLAPVEGSKRPFGNSVWSPAFRRWV